VSLRLALLTDYSKTQNRPLSYCRFHYLRRSDGRGPEEQLKQKKSRSYNGRFSLRCLGARYGDLRDDLYYFGVAPQRVARIPRRASRMRNTANRFQLGLGQKKKILQSDIRFPSRLVDTRIYISRGADARGSELLGDILYRSSRAGSRIPRT